MSRDLTVEAWNVLKIKVFSSALLFEINTVHNSFSFQKHWRVSAVASEGKSAAWETGITPSQFVHKSEKKVEKGKLWKEVREEETWFETWRRYFPIVYVQPYRSDSIINLMHIYTYIHPVQLSECNCPLYSMQNWENVWCKANEAPQLLCDMWLMMTWVIKYTSIHQSLSLEMFSYYFFLNNTNSGTSTLCIGRYRKLIWNQCLKKFKKYI